MPSPENVVPAPTKYEEAEAAAAAGPAAASERDAPFIFDGVSPNLDEREIRGRERGREGGGEWNWEKLSLRRGPNTLTAWMRQKERRLLKKVQRLLDIVATSQVPRQNSSRNDDLNISHNKQ